MRLLLDTHAFLWWASNAPQLPERTRSLIGDPDAAVFVSAASAWEAAIKAGRGLLEVPADLGGLSASQLERHNFSALPVSFAHAVAVRDLPPHHKDPFDRLLVAQARVEGLTLVSADPLLTPYGVPIAW